MSIYTAGAILAAAPALADYASVMALAYTGSVALGHTAATAVSIGSGILAIGTIGMGVNEGIAALTGYNIGREFMGDGIYNTISTIISLGGALYITGGAVLPYPSTCKYPDSTSPENLKEQVILYEGDYEKTLENRIKEKPDIVYIDPPYKTDYAIKSIKILQQKSLLKSTKTIIIETYREEIIKELEKLKNIIITDIRKYGRASIVFTKITNS